MLQHFKTKKDHPVKCDWICNVPGLAVSAKELALASLLPFIDGYRIVSCNISSCFITAVTVDSRKVTTGSLFIAVAGSQVDGHDFVAQAVDNGCSAIMVERGHLDLSCYESSDVCVIEVKNSRNVYGIIAETLFSHPALEMTMVGVTGTNGKTTVTYLLESLLRSVGKQAGIIGTICYRYHDREGERIETPSSFTTPEPMLLQYTLRCMANAGVDTVIMEVSSHGLEQARLGRFRFDIAAFTNLSRDHLDYHKSMDAYFAAKTALFTEHLLDGGVAVITGRKKDFTDPNSWSERLKKICCNRHHLVLTCGAKGADIFPLTARADLRGSTVRLQSPQGESDIVSPLVGDFNVENIQTVFAVAMALGIETQVVCRAFLTAAGAPGRLQRIVPPVSSQSWLPTVFVDYAHTPDALQQVIQTVSKLSHKTLFCVFGCGGDRDMGKRSLMGEVSGRYCDVVVLCDDNPRSEAPAKILESVAEGVVSAGMECHDASWLLQRSGSEKGFVVVSDRSAAIRLAITAAGADDIVLIAGKGHEQYQLTASGRRFFDDTLEAEEALGQWRLQSLLEACGGQCTGVVEKDTAFSRVLTDSRKVSGNEIFLALKGEHFDGHDYVEQVVEAGAGCLILHQKPQQALPVPVIVTEDTERALGDLAAWRRQIFKSSSKPVVAAITGSSGKTTVKEMCAAIFYEQWQDLDTVPAGRVLKTRGNFNNLIGLPLSLLPVTSRHKAIILEMGMNHPGEIARLTEIADPDIACIVNVHGAHLQGLGDIEGVSRAKGELFKGCGKETVLVVNGDDKRVLALADESSHKKIIFALTRNDKTTVADVWASDIRQLENEKQQFTLHRADESSVVVLQIPGRHNVSNALAAAAIATAAGISVQRIAAGLSGFLPTDRRMQILAGPAGSRIINDTYNANPESMKAGITVLSTLGTGQRVAVLGDMLELGAKSDVLHGETGTYLAQSGIDYLGLLGEFASFTAAAAEKEGMSSDHIKVCSSKEECISWLQELVAADSVGEDSYILVKGSRGMQLEEIVGQLTTEKSS